MNEEHVLSTDVRLALIFYAPTSKNLKGHFERVSCVSLFVISFDFSKWLESLFGVKI